jgi:PAS domain S-box-containing protein
MPSGNTFRVPQLPEERSDPPDLDPILDVAPCGFLTVDAAGFVQQANSTLAELVGRSRGEIIGQHIDHLLSPPARIFYSTHLFPLLRIEGHADELYVPILDADGAQVPALVNGRSRRDGDRELFDFVIVPMRQRNELESELIATRNAAQEGAAAKDRFLSVVSHELRTPLTGIKGYAELLLRQRRAPLTVDQRRYIERIRDAASYQAALIDDILDFAAIGEARELDRVAIPVEEVLARAESLLTVRARELRRAIRRRPRPAEGFVQADARATQQILLNLGMNALKYGREGTVVTIEAAVEERRALIRVIDEGEGIAPDMYERIFEPFVQLPSSELSAINRQGVGLGLAISRDLAHAMDGDITVSSEQGVGSTFTLELPVAPTPA